MDRLADALLSTPEMSAIFSDGAWVQRMLDAEAALARAEEAAGVLPPGTAAAIADACRAELFSADAIVEQGAVVGTPVIPLVRMLGERVEGTAAEYVHFGATSQDIIDTGLVLQMRDGMALLLTQLVGLGGRCADLAERHRTTATVARTLGQHAVPMPFGLKAAQWLASVTHHIGRIQALEKTHLVAQLGGAGGTLAVLGESGERVAHLFSQELGLATPELPWHTRRDRIAEIVCALGVLAGAMGKIATDLLLLSQTEVGEIRAVPDGEKGASSAMPHKQNPVDPAFAIAAVNHAIGSVPVMLASMVQEHERAAGGWQAEWVAVPRAFGATAAAVRRVSDAVAEMQVDVERMRTTVAMTDDRIMSEVVSAALVLHLGRRSAQRLVSEADRVADASKRPFRVVLVEQIAALGVLKPDDADALLDPHRADGSADAYIDRALEQFRVLGDEDGPTPRPPP